MSKRPIIPQGKCSSKVVGKVVYDNPEEKLSKYQRRYNSLILDVYDILAAYNVTNPAVQHAIKKLLMPGERGSKDKITDMKEALFSIQRAIELEVKSRV